MASQAHVREWDDKMIHSVYEKLLALRKPIRVALAGAGEFGREMATQISHIRNMELSAISDLDCEKAKKVFLDAGIYENDIIFTDSVSKASELIRKGRHVILENALDLPKLPVDAICDVTGSPVFGAELAFRSIDAGKHTVIINIESDVGVGAILRRKADAAGVVYTEADGDQPSLIKGLYDHALVLGMNVKVAGKWTTIHPEEFWDTMDGRVNAGYMDGSKNQVEMCCVANMLGFKPDIRGMHKPALKLNEIADAFTLIEEGGILSDNKVVDVVNCLSRDGKTRVESVLGGGVFIIASSENKVFNEVIQAKGIIHSKNGKNALIYRPYHLVGIEAPMSIIKAVLYNEPTAAPLETPVADVISIAKTDLKAGASLDGIGGITVRGEIETVECTRNNNYLPLCLAEGVKINRDIPKGTPLTYDMLEKDGDSFIWKLRKEQDLETAVNFMSTVSI